MVEFTNRFTAKLLLSIWCFCDVFVNISMLASSVCIASMFESAVPGFGCAMWPQCVVVSQAKDLGGRMKVRECG